MINGAIMKSFIVFVFRLVAGVVSLFVTWFVFDNIHDRNTEIIVSIIGLLYAFVFLISRRFQYFGLSIFSFFGRTSSYVQSMPYDHVLPDEIAAHRGHHLYLNVLFASLIEVLCLFRLFTSLLNHGWGLLSDPIHKLLAAAPF